jgi:Fe-S-cluster-containing hydrogenase component 2
MNALAMDNFDQFGFEPVRCIGCGLCSGVCPTGSVQIKYKSMPEQPKIPIDTARTYINIARVQGARKLINLIKMWFMHQYRHITRRIRPSE